MGHFIFVALFFVIIIFYLLFFILYINIIIQLFVLMNKMNFQHLPSVIIHNIAHFYKESSRAHYSLHHTQTVAELGSRQLPFLAVCQSWRAAVLRDMYSTLKIDLQAHHINSACFKQCNRLVKISTRCPETLERQHVLRVKVNVDIGQILSGFVLGVLCQPPFAKWVFPNCRNLTLHIDCNYSTISEDNSSSRAKANVDSFVRQLSKVAPHAGSAKVVFNKTSAINGILGVFAGWLLAHLCRDKRRVLYSAELGIEYSSFKQLHCDRLTHLRFDWDSNHMTFVRLAQAQSGTLFSLTACSLQVRDLDTLILGSNAAPVTFRNVSYLRLVFSKTEDGGFSTRTPIDRATAIFPNLQTMLIDGEYTLCNDMLFRGDRSALRQLRLTINPRTLDTLCASGVLVRQKYSSLRCVALGATGFHSGTNAQSDNLLQLLTNMSACARILDISRMVSHDEASIAPSKLVRGISFGKLGHNLQVLDMGTCELGYFEMLSVIGAMSHLTDMHCKPLDFESTFSFMPESKVYQFMSETFGPLNTNFRFWRVGAVGTISMKSLAKMAIMMAIICPNFMFASVAPKNKDEYERHISKALGAPETNEYVERIRPLLCDHYDSSNY